MQVTPATVRRSWRVGAEVFLHVHHHRREDAETLYGFTSIEERRVFETLIGTHGVGPALGLAILSVHSPLGLRHVLATDDVAALCLVPGVGKKTAARLLIELKSRLALPDIDARHGPWRRGRSPVVPRCAPTSATPWPALGYGADEIGRALAELPDRARLRRAPA